MKMEDHFKETLNRAVANEPPVLDAWDRFERRAHRGRNVRLFASLAAAAAVVVVAVIVVPQLGTGTEVRIPPSTQPPSTTPTPTDPYANFQGVQDQAESWILQYPQSWTQSEIENVTLFQPRDVEPAMKGDPTFVLDVRVENEVTFPPPDGDKTFAPAATIAGRATYRSEVRRDGAHVVTYRVDWSRPCAPQTTCPKMRTLVVAVRAGDEILWERYINDAQLVVDSIEYSDTEAG